MQHTTFCDILQERAAGAPDQKAFIFLGPDGEVVDELTFGQLDRRARAIAGELAANDLAGKRVLLLFPPGLDFVAALFGCFYAGSVGVPVPFLVRYRSSRRIKSIRNDADPAGILTTSRLKASAAFREQLFGACDGVIWIATDAIERDDPAIGSSRPNPDDLALLQYSSGSTGSPKGVMLSHANLLANNVMIAEAFGRSRRVVGWLPLFHDMGLIGHVLHPVFVGGLSVLMSPLSFLQRPLLWLRAISKWQATTSGGPSHGYELCLRAIGHHSLDDIDLTSWSVAYCGSEKVRADILHQFSARLAGRGFRRQSIVPCYGLAEATLFVSAVRPGTGLSTTTVANAAGSYPDVASCGRAGCGSSVAIVDPRTRICVDDTAVGEIWVQGPHVAQGYWRAVGGDPFAARTADGSGTYLRTGDLGFMRGGELFVVGRLKDVIIVNGLNHHAEDIEISAARSHPLCLEFGGAVFAIDSGGQEHAVLVQEIRRNRASPSELTTIAGHAMASVTREYGFRLFDIVLVRPGALPRTSSGKVMRWQARALYLEGRFDRRLNAPLARFSCHRSPPEVAAT